MFTHHLWLALRSLRRNPALAALCILILAIGIAASMASLTLLHVRSADPMPGHSQRLFVPGFDNRPPENSPGEVEPMLTLTWTEADALLRAGQGRRRTALYGLAMTVTPERAGLAPFFSEGMAATADFFALFQAPFAHGGAWSAADDEAGRDVVVLTDELARRLFGRADVLGRSVQLGDRPYRVVGVLAPWRPVPRLWRLSGSSAIGPVEPFVIPLRNAIGRELANNGWTSCSGQRAPGYAAFLAAECNFLDYWVELAPQDIEPYRATLQAHAAAQRQRGRLLRSDRAWLTPLAARADRFGVVGDDTKLQAGLSLAFLAACLVNVVGLLAARFANRAGEVGVRRALGATRRQIMAQFLVEAGLVGAAGAVLGLLLTWGALALIGQRSEELEAIAKLDAPMLVLAVALSLAGALLAGLWPTWRASRVRPAMQLKSQ